MIGKLLNIIFLFFTVFVNVYGQEEQKVLQKANNLYKQKQFDLSLPEYRKAVTINPENPVAHYNFGNVLFRKEQWPDAEIAYNKAMELAKTTAAKEKAVYNKGVAYSRQKKLEESIQAYKNALKLDPNDEDARVNLQKALHELNKQQSGEKSQKKEQKKQQQREQPKQNQSKLNKKQVEQLLKALRQKEQEVQQKMQQQRTRTTSNPEKDW